MHLRHSALICALLGALASGCSSTSHLVAGDGSHRLVARDGGSGITIVLTTEAWPGDAAYGEDLTIVHVLIANMGSEPVLLAPGDFRLRDRRGFEYVLYDAGGSFDVLPPGAEPNSFAEQRGLHAYDPGRSSNYENIRSDDGELARLALPWGVLLPGTQMRGFLYFDDVRDTANFATLIWHAQTPEHRAIADFGFALHVARLGR